MISFIKAQIKRWSKFKKYHGVKIWNCRSWSNEIFSWHASETKSRMNFSFSGEICKWFTREIQYGQLQSIKYTYGYTWITFQKRWATKGWCIDLRSLVGSLIYLTSISPDIIHAVSIVSKFISEPRKYHFARTIRILWYIKGTKNFGSLYKAEYDYKIKVFTDNDWAGYIDDRKGTSGYVFQLSSKAISWSSKKQATILLSSAEPNTLQQQLLHVK